MSLVDLDLCTIECAACGIIFAFSCKLVEHRRETKGDVWCPNGHRIGMNVKEGKR